MAEVALLRHLHAAARVSGTAGAAGAFHFAASQLQALSAPALRHAEAADLAEELLERAEQLTGSKEASSRLLGLKLLHTAICSCHRRTFLQQHAQWAALLLAALRTEQQQRGQQQQQQAQPSAVALQACSCLAAYFDRIGRMLDVPGLRRDGAAAASKAAALLLQQPGKKQQQQQQQQPGKKQQQQQQQQQQGLAAQQAAAAEEPAPPLLAAPQGQEALLAALAALPASLRQQQKGLEAALLLMLMRTGSTGNAAGGARLAACVAALPSIAGDGSSWSAQCQRLLATAHRLADVALLQLDDAQLAAAARGATDPAAEPLPLLPAPGVAGGKAGGSGTLGADAYAAALAQLDAVLLTLQAMLSGSYPAAVPVPAGGLLLLVSRIASVDDSAASTGGRAAAASSRVPQLRLQLPALQAAALRLLQRLLAASGAAAAPYFVAAARLLSELLQRSAAGSGTLASSALVRCQLYATTRQLLVTAGVGVTRHLAPALLPAAMSELYGRKQQQGAGDGAEGPARKKARKSRQAAMDLEADAAAAAPLDDLGATAQLRDQAVQATALQALQALCAAGAPLLAAQQRRQLDDAAAHMASSTAAAASQQGADAESAVGASLAALQLSAYQLLLATLLAPTPHRPPHLAPALRLFQDGAGAGGSAALAAFCRNALLSCEALLHPRSLPPPAAVRRTAAAAAAADAGSGDAPALGMPRFWSSVDAALLLQQEQLRLQQAQPVLAPQQGDPAPAPQPEAAQNTAAAGSDEVMAEAAEAAAGQEAPVAAAPAPVPAAAVAARTEQPPAPPAQPALLQPPSAAPSGMAAMLASHAAAPLAAAGPAPVATTGGAAKDGGSALPPAPTPPAFGTTAAFAPAPAAAAAAAVAAAAAAEEEEDSEGSLPEIDSGDGSSDSSSDSEGESS